MHTGNLWILITVVGVIILGAALAYGMRRNSGRDRSLDAATEAATRDQYRPNEHPYTAPADASGGAPSDPRQGDTTQA